MKKILAAAMISAMIIIPASAQQPAKYELGNYNFSFDKEQDIQNIEFKNTENTVTQQITPLKQNTSSDNPSAINNSKEFVIDENKKQNTKSIDAQKQVVKQIKQEEIDKSEQSTQAERKEDVINETQESQINEHKKQELVLPTDKEEIKTPLPQSSVTPSPENFKLKTNLPPKTHTPMPNQKVLDETQSLTTGEMPVKRVVQPTKSPAKEPQRVKFVEDKSFVENILTQDEKTQETSEIQTIDKTNKTEQPEKSQEQKVKEKKKLPFTFELQKMQYNGVDSRQL